MSDSDIVSDAPRAPCPPAVDARPAAPPALKRGRPSRPLTQEGALVLVPRGKSMRVTGRRGGKERGLPAPSPSSPRALIHSGRARRHRGQAAQRAAHRREAGGAREDLGENRYIDDLSVDVRPAVRPRSVPGPGPSAPSQKPGLVAPHPTTPHHTTPHLTSPHRPHHNTPHRTTPRCIMHHLGASTHRRRTVPRDPAFARRLAEPRGTEAFSFRAEQDVGLFLSANCGAFTFAWTWLAGEARSAIGKSAVRVGDALRTLCRTDPGSHTHASGKTFGEAKQPHHTTPHHTTPHHTAPHRTAPHSNQPTNHTTPHHTTRHQPINQVAPDISSGRRIYGRLRPSQHRRVAICGLLLLDWRVPRF